MFFLTLFKIIIDHIDDYHHQNLFLPLSVHSFPLSSDDIKMNSFLLASNPLSALERRYRLCSTLLDHPPSLPSPPLAIDSNDKLSDLLVKESDEIRDDESIISTSTIADDENMINNIETENIHLLKTLSYNRELRSLSPVLKSPDLSTTKNSESIANLSTTTTVDIKREMNETSVLPGGNELEKKDRPLVEGTDKVTTIFDVFSSNPFICLFRFQSH